MHPRHLDAASGPGRFPLGASLRLTDLERFDNAPLLAQLREQEPVTWFAEEGLWLVTSKRLVDEVHAAPDRFGSRCPRIRSGSCWAG